MAVYPPKRLLWAMDRAVVSRSIGMEPFSRGRRALELLSKVAPPPRSVQVEPDEYGNVPGLTFRPPGSSGAPSVLYLHGGGYCYGSPSTHLGPVAHIALATGAVVFSADYPLAPEAPCPAARTAALAAYDAICAAAGAPPFLSGDSAGGGLSLTTAIEIRETDRTPPPGLALISPWVDLTCAAESVRRNAGKDALLKPQYVDRAAAAYAGELDRGDPLVSPLGADLGGLPPVLIQTGADELLLDEGLQLARRLEAAGVETQSKTWPGMWHDFQIHAGMLREADEAIAEMAAWMGARRAAQPASA